MSSLKQCLIYRCYNFTFPVLNFFVFGVNIQLPLNSSDYIGIQILHVVGILSSITNVQEVLLGGGGFIITLYMIK